MPQALFYVFSFFTLITAAGVVVSRNAVNAALYLLLSLVGVAGLFTLLDAYLLAALLVLVYAGAVVALFLFIVMLLDTQGGARKPFKHMTAVASTVGLALLLTGLATLAGRSGLASTPAPVTAAGTPPVGAVLKHYAEMLFTTYLLPVQVMGFLLLIAMLGVIVLSRKVAAEDVK
jgi:NADH-quinone oxidoreductase subunit J